MAGLNARLMQMVVGDELSLLKELLPPWAPSQDNDIEEVLQVIDIIDAIANRKIPASLFEKSFVQF